MPRKKKAAKKKTKAKKHPHVEALREQLRAERDVGAVWWVTASSYGLQFRTASIGIGPGTQVKVERARQRALLLTW